MTEIDTKIDKLIDLVAHVESGGDYSKWNPDDRGSGPSFGLIQFNSKKGSLGKLIMEMKAAKPEWWPIVFERLIYKQFIAQDMNANSLAPVIVAWPEAAKDALQLSGQVPIWQKCQRDLARAEYFEPAAKLCAKHGLESERAHAMAFDVAVQYGAGGLAEKLEKAERQTSHEVFMDRSKEKQTLIALARLADTHGYDNNRRHNLLASPALSDGPMFPPQRPTLRQGQPHGGYLQELQEALVALGYLKPAQCRGDFSPALAAAVKVFQADHDLVVDGICGPLTWQALDKALAARGGTP